MAKSIALQAQNAQYLYITCKNTASRRREATHNKMLVWFEEYQYFCFTCFTIPKTQRFKKII